MSIEHVAMVAADGSSTSTARSKNERLSLRTNFSWMIVGNVVYAGCQWGMLSMMAKLGTPTMVGQFVLALAISTVTASQPCG